jgi:uncharacterized protein YgiM (DUF1202 family)
MHRLRFIKQIIFFIFFSSVVFKTYGQRTFVVNTEAVNLHTKASAGSAVVGTVHYGDTVFLKSAKGNWLNVSLKEGKQGFLLNKFVTPVIETIPAKNISNRKEIDMSGWNFSFLFSATFKYFLLITVIILFALLLIYYLK